MSVGTETVGSPASAIDGGTFGIRPELESDFFHINLAPGAAIEANAIVSNHTDAPVALLNYAVDGQSTTTLGKGTFTLAPTFNLSVPANTYRSNYSAAIGSTAVNPYVSTITFTIA